MSTDRKLTKAQLIEIAWQDQERKPKSTGRQPLTVQFNPASLKATYSNQVNNKGDTGASLQFVGRGDSKLALELIFDVSGRDATNTRDVRKMTAKVAFFMQTQKEPGKNDQDTRYKVPGVRFQWGSFLFDGVMVSMDETLELWSEDGQPLRATVAISLSQPGINFNASLSPDSNPQATESPGTGRPAGTDPIISAPAGVTLQELVANAGISTDWKAVASVNGIENPRDLATGGLVNLRTRASLGGLPGDDLQAGASLRTSLTAQTSIRVS